MLLLTLRGLRGPMTCRLIREKLLHVGGPAAYSYLLGKITCGDPLNLSLHILQTLDNFLDDINICGAVHDAGVTSQLLDLVPRYVSQQHRFSQISSFLLLQSSRAQWTSCGLHCLRSV